MADDQGFLEQLSDLGLDEEQMAAVQAALAARAEEVAMKEKELLGKEAQLRVSTDEELASKYPRIIKAVRAGVETVPEGVELESWLGQRETYLQALGVPAPQEAQPKVDEGVSGWGTPMVASASPPPGMEDALRQAMLAGTTEDIVMSIHALHAAGHKEKVRSVVAEFQDARPIISS